MENQVNDTVFPVLTRHQPPTHPKWVNAQSQDSTPFPDAAIAGNQIISVSRVRDVHILNPAFRVSKFSRVRKNAGGDRRFMRDGMPLFAVVPSDVVLLSGFRPYLNPGAGWGCSRRGYLL